MLLSEMCFKTGREKFFCHFPIAIVYIHILYYMDFGLIILSLREAFIKKKV